MHSAVMKNILLRYSRVFAEILRLHFGEQFVHCTLHPNIDRKSLYSMQTKQQGAVGNFHTYACYFHKFPASLFIICCPAFFKLNLAACNLLCSVNKIAVSEACPQRCQIIGSKTGHSFCRRKSKLTVGKPVPKALTKPVNNSFYSFDIIVLRNNKRANVFLFR